MMNKNMTVEEARKILGTVWDGISDAQIEWMITLFSMFSKLAISQHIASKKKSIKSSLELDKFK